MLTLLILATTLLAQEPAAPVEMTPVEKQFQEMLANVTMEGYFTVGDAAETRPDRYVIERVTKIKDDVWKFDARVLYNGKDFKASVPVPVKWAGDVPVLTLNNYAIAGQGVFSARILMYNGMYAGTWGAQAHGGKMFGKIVKNDAPKSEPAK
jgi:hypothetical protein